MRILVERREPRGLHVLTVSCGGGKKCLNDLSRECGYRVAEVSCAIGCSERYLRALFLRDVGLTPKEWMRQERMILACRLLSRGLSPAEAGAELGFATANNFRREFQAVSGLSPIGYLKMRGRAD